MASLSDGVPDALVRSIREGRCVAFVGAGFSIPSVPPWRQLLEKLIARVDAPAVASKNRAESVSARRQALIEWWSQPHLSSRDYEGLGSAVQAALGPRFEEELRACLPLAPPASSTTTRIRLLSGIPFHYVLTTNFDDYLGEPALPAKGTYAQVAAARRRSWWSEAFWSGSSEPLWADRLMAMHGRRDGRGLVFTTQAYRERLHRDPAYKNCLRTLFTTNTVLYLGFSFTDAYVNDLRSEILAMIGLDGAARDVRDFAILEDVPVAAQHHLEHDEGLTPLVFDTSRDGEKKKDFTGFDHWLKAIHDATNPAATLRQRVGNGRILWVDPNRSSNQHGVQTLARAAEGQVVQVDSVEAALEKVRSIRPSDVVLIVTRWGHRPGQDADAIQLLKRLPVQRPPVVVFASGDYRDKNRELALTHGALAYTDSWSELFEVVDDRFGDARRRTA